MSDIIYVDLDADQLSVNAGPDQIKVVYDIGPTGRRGSLWFTGAGEPGPGLIPEYDKLLQNDMYLNTVDGWIYQYLMLPSNVLDWVKIATAGTDTTAVDAKSTTNTKTVNTLTAAASVTVSTAYAVNKLTMGQDTTITPSLAADSDPITSLHLSGAFTPTWAASVKWPDGTAPSYTSPAVYVFLTVDGGTSWVGVQSGKAFA